jgi:hypothetical protein
MKRTLIVLVGVALISSSALAGPPTGEMHRCVLGKIGDGAFGTVMVPIPHHPAVGPSGRVDLGYGHRRPQPFSFAKEPTVTLDALHHAVSQCNHEMATE